MPESTTRRGYHGTSPAIASTILREGFKEDCWFALHMEDARAFGGPHILVVDFEESQLPLAEDRELGTHSWQFHHPGRISADRVVAHFRCEEVTENSSSSSPPG